MGRFTVRVCLDPLVLYVLRETQLLPTCLLWVVLAGWWLAIGHIVSGVAR